MSIRDWIRNAAGNDDTVKDHIIIHMLPKYGVCCIAKEFPFHIFPQNPNKGRSNKRLTKRTLSDFSSDGDVTSSTSEITTMAPTGMSLSIIPKLYSRCAVPKVAHGAFYDPRLNKDFGGDFFNLVQNKLVQLDVVDTDGNLIPPWEFYDALKPGTLVLLCASLHCYVMRDKGGVRKVT